MGTVAVRPIDIKQLSVAEQVHAIQFEAYSREATLVGVKFLPPIERSAEDIQGLAESFFGAFLGDALVGVISECEGSDLPQVEICSLAVLPQFQRQGVGRALLQRSVGRAAGKPMLVSTAAANAGAISLYQSVGFSVFRRSTAANSKSRVGAPPLPDL